MGGYRLLRSLGRGSFGRVWEAEGAGGERVALKFVRCASGAAAAREVSGVLALRVLGHPGLVQVHRVWGDRGCVVLAMELADGSLQDLFDAYLAESGGPLPQRSVCRLLAPAAEALDFLNAPRHPLRGRRVGYQHGDVKPGNLLVCGGVVKLADYGLASPLEADVAPHRRAGTPAYAAPELARGRLSRWTDQYALAVTYCLLRGGRLPFPDGPADIRAGAAPEEPDLCMLPEAERPVVARALAEAPQRRWPTCGELVAQLARLTPVGGAAA